jgi:hypothetical protein
MSLRHILFDVDPKQLAWSQGSTSNPVASIAAALYALHSSSCAILTLQMQLLQAATQDLLL